MQKKQLPLYLRLNPNDKKKGMYLIGEFSKISNVTTETLRHYEDIGILIPELVDKENGYRYYSKDQLKRLEHIRRLASAGFTLKEIKSFDDITIAERIETYKKKKNDLLNKIEIIDELIRREEK